MPGASALWASGRDQLWRSTINPRCPGAIGAFSCFFVPLFLAKIVWTVWSCFGKIVLVVKILKVVKCCRNISGSSFEIFHEDSIGMTGMTSIVLKQHMIFACKKLAVSVEHLWHFHINEHVSNRNIAKVHRVPVGLQLLYMILVVSWFQHSNGINWCDFPNHWWFLVVGCWP